jgi:hypothetical protein
LRVLGDGGDHDVVGGEAEPVREVVDGPVVLQMIAMSSCRCGRRSGAPPHARPVAAVALDL